MDNLKKLETLNLYNFNQIVGDSLNELINLRTLRFGDDFNKPIKESLKRLINLKVLKISSSYKESCENLTNLVK